MKKTISIATFLSVAVMLFLVGCGKKKVSEKIKVTVDSGIGSLAGEVLQEITNEFMIENPKADVDFIRVETDYESGGRYESIMREKMASNDLPDIFSTHGWAKRRYGEFLEDLRYEKWAKDISHSIKPMVTDDDGKVYVLPLEVDKSGIVYNAGILTKYDIETPSTLEEFVQACKIIRDKSRGEIIPIHIAGFEDVGIGNFFDYLALPLYITDSKHSEAKKLLSGNFDWKNWDKLGELFLELYDNKLINVNAATSNYQDSIDLFAAEKVAFGFYGASFTQEVLDRNPSVNISMIPIPSYYSGDAPIFVGGEKNTLGIWKNGKNKEAAKEYLKFLARPENMSRIASASNLPAGLSGVKSDLGILAGSFLKYEDYEVFPYFDRVYLPDGMWDFICSGGRELLMGNISPREYSEILEKEYKRLIKEQH